MKWQVYADGSICDYKKGGPRILPAGWATVVKSDALHERRELSGSMLESSLPRVETMGIQQGIERVLLSTVERFNSIQIFSDCQSSFRELYRRIDQDDRASFLEQSSIPDAWRRAELLVRPILSGREAKDLEDMLQSVEIIFMKVRKSTAPVEHKRCHFLAARERIRLCLETGQHTKNNPDVLRRYGIDQTGKLVC